MWSLYVIKKLEIQEVHKRIIHNMHSMLHFIYSAASEPELKTISCPLCRREVGVWNLFPLAHVPTEQEDSSGQDAPSYLDTGQMCDEERSPRQIHEQEESCSISSDRTGSDITVSEKADQTEPMEQSGSLDQADKASTEETAMDKSYISVGTLNTPTLKPINPMGTPTGLKSPLHRSMTNLPGEETTESLCVEVENESLSERLQDVESELELMGCGREGNSEKEDDGPRAKRRRLQVWE